MSLNEILKQDMNATLAISAAELREVLTEWATQLLANHPQKEVDDEDLKLLTRAETAGVATRRFGDPVEVEQGGLSPCRKGRL